MSLLFLSFLLMLVFSNALISFSNLFRSPETALLFSVPLRQDTLYLYKLFESLVFRRGHFSRWACRCCWHMACNPRRAGRFTQASHFFWCLM